MAKGCFIPEWPLKELSVKTIFYQDFVILLDFFFFFFILLREVGVSGKNKARVPG